MRHADRCRCGFETTGLAILLIIVFAWVSAPADAITLGHEFLAPDHWIYDVLYRFESLGLVDLPSYKPYSRDDVARYTKQIESRIAGGWAALSARDRYNLERLQKEFTQTASRANPEMRYDPPLLFTSDAPFHIEGDVDLTSLGSKPLLDERWAFFGVGRPEARIHIGDKATYEVRYRVTMGPERGDRVRDSKPSPRERSFNGLTSVFERSYVVFPWKQATLFWGRDYVDYGPSENGNLLVSQNAQSLDKFGGRLRFKNLRVSTVHANLSAEARRYLSAHRLEISAGRFVVGLSESVLYLHRGFDPAYLLPLSSFYSNQFNEREDDNVLWSFDLKYRARRGILLYGSFLIDDFQFEREEGSPDKTAFDLGLRAAVARPFSATFRLRYRFVDIYTYTHRDSGKAYVTGHGDPTTGDPILGAEQGPDSDLLQASAEFYPLRNVVSVVGFSVRRRGEGNDFRRFQQGAEAFPSFPFGVVERTFAVSYGVVWELGGNSSVGIDVQRAFVENVDHDAGRDDWHTAARFHLTWDL